VIGLEVAASARALGRDVVVVEAAPRLMGRYAPEALAADIQALHEHHGVRFIVGVAPVKFEITGGRVSGVQLRSGEILPADVVVVGIGVAPRDELAIAADLEVDDGVVVNPYGRTSDPHIWAAGDVARMRQHPADPVGVRLESWQPAVRQAEHTAANMLGAGTPYNEVPWTWSDQYDRTVQMTGRAQPDSHHVFFGTLDESALLILETQHDRHVLRAAYGMSRGAGIGKVIAATQILIKHGQELTHAELIEADNDYKRISKVLARAAREVLSREEPT
jgi:3-phenylpropionate/trans-cinnamate dioxygenase ferredoxin reductase subunit